MSDRNRPYRPYSRKTRSIGRAARAGELSREAGRLSGERPLVEQLEKRQMLFSLTVTPDDVAPGSALGTVQTYFSYTLPQLARTQPITQPPQPRDFTEDFNDEIPAVLGSGTRFLGSQIQIFHNVTPAGDVSVQPPDLTQNQRFLRLALTTVGEFVSFRFADPDTQPPAVPRIQQVVAAEFTIGNENVLDSTGFEFDRLKVQLIANNNVILELQGFQQLQPFFAPAVQPASRGIGTFRFDLRQLNLPQGGFDTIRIEAIAPSTTGVPAFTLDNLRGTIIRPDQQLLQRSNFGATVVLTGPIGATVVVRDLYGEDMVTSVSVSQIDPDGNGRPNLNDGIGSIQLLNTDSRTALTIWGGAWTEATQAMPDDDFFDFTAGRAFKLGNEVLGNYGAMEQAGFGFIATAPPGGQLQVRGLPPGSGSVVIGSPIVRDVNNYQPNNPFVPVGTPITTGFVRPDQGIFVEGGRSIGSIQIHGMLFGSSRFTGAVDRINIGTLYGSITVDGDLGSLVVGSSAGMWSFEPDLAGANVNARQFKTNGQLVVGRTLGEVAIGGYSAMDITVAGDVNNPTQRVPRDFTRYYEKEFISPLDPANVTPIGVIRSVIGYNGGEYGDRGGIFRNDAEQSLIFGDFFLRNDTIATAEFIGSAATSVRIIGDLSAQNSIMTGEDTNDVFAFVVDGTQDIVVDLSSVAAVAQVRIMDQDGRTLAAPNRTIGRAGDRFEGRFNFKPNGPGVYYLVVSDDVDTGFTTVPYTLQISGMAPVTFGALRTGGSLGVAQLPTSITLLAGSMGALRPGTGINSEAGEDAPPTPVINRRPAPYTADDEMAWDGGSVSIPNHLYSIFAGSDIGGRDGSQATPITLDIGGNLGYVVTGLSSGGGTPGPNEGDLNFLSLRVGGSIAALDIRGGIGMDQDAANPRGAIGFRGTVIETGRSGGRGDIGLFRTGFHIGGEAMTLTTSPGSIIQSFLVSQDSYTDGNPATGIYSTQGFGPRGVIMNTGAGSDIRFFDVPLIDGNGQFDVTTPLFTDQSRQFIDDGGAQVRVTVTGGSRPAGVAGTVRVLPVDRSGGVAIGQIVVDLAGGRNLNIDALLAGGPTPGGGNPQQQRGGTVGIGRIVVTNADAFSTITMSGPVQIDILRIDQTGGTAFGAISNDTPGGDIVAIDVQALNTLSVVQGNLGRTQVVPWGPRTIGPFLGVDDQPETAARGILGFTGGVNMVDVQFNGETFRPVKNDAFDAGNAFLDDVGGPFDGWLNGIVVRTGSVQSVAVTGSIGDVILQGGAGTTLGSVVANSDRLPSGSGFDGIIGNIYAFDIGTIDIGDGVAESEQSPLQTVSIMAADDIAGITSSRESGAVLRGAVIAGNIDLADTVPGSVEGLGSIRLNNAEIRGAFLASRHMDAFWEGLAYGETGYFNGDIGEIRGNNLNVVDSFVEGRDLRDMTLTNGFYDASSSNFSRRILTMNVQGFRNSTLTGGDREFRRNLVSVSGDLDQMTVVGSMEDLIIRVTGTVTQSIQAADITRATIGVDNIMTSLSVSGNIRASEISVGDAPSITIARDMQNSVVRVSGILATLSAGDRIVNSDISVTGPDGRLQSITASRLISGKISASGPIDSVSVTNGDLVADITTTTTNGNVGVLRASRDVAITADISGTLNRIDAGRHIGRDGAPGVILVRRDFAGAVATTGQLYSDIRVGGAITGAITIAQVSSKPERNFVGTGSIIAFGRIGAVTVNGDFNGDIISYTGGLGNITINNGSLLPGRTVAAYDGNVENFVINNGHLLGNVIADYDIRSVRVVAGADGVFGDVGVNPALSQFTRYDDLRNQLPVGVSVLPAAQGPRIYAGQRIVSFVVTNGSVFESVFQAGRAIQSISINGEVRNDPQTRGIGSAFVAGDTIDGVSIAGSVRNAAFLAGVVDLGEDNRPGGTGSKADRVQSGVLNSVTIGGDIADSIVAAGTTAGFDGIYNNADDRQVLGLSSVNTFSVRGGVANTSIYSDALGSVSGDNRFTKNTSVPSANPDLDSGVGTPGTAFSGTGTFNFGGGTVTLVFAGPGQAFFNGATGKVTLRNTNTTSSLRVESSLASLNNFDIVTNDDASLGRLQVIPTLTGDSDVVIDGAANTLEFGTINMSNSGSNAGGISVGGDVGAATFANVSGGTMNVRRLSALVITGDFGAANPLIFGEAKIQAVEAGTLSFRGGVRAAVSVDRGATSVTSVQAVDRAAFRFGNSLTSFTAPAISGTVISVGDSLGTVAIAGAMFDSAIVVGTDLGTDSAFGGTGTAADRITSGFLGTVTVGGDFRESDVVAGYTRGADGFFGTADDVVASGLSTIGSVTVTGTQVGSTRFTESYRIAATGSTGTIRIGGAGFSGSRGNFAVENGFGALSPISIQLRDVLVTQESRVFTANLIFNQAIDISTLSRALSVSEVRGTANVLIRLIEGTDYTLSYDAPTNTGRVRFNKAVTDQNLPLVTGVPGPGVYRFELEQNILRGKVQGNQTDGDGDGYSRPGDKISVDAVVGDPGDKLVNSIVPSTGQIGTPIRVDFYSPINLDWVLDNNSRPDGLADTNRTVTIRGSIGDHQDNDTNQFRFNNDVDLYNITLQAGQIVRLGTLLGSARSAGLTLISPQGARTIAADVDFDPFVFAQGTQTQQILIKTTGVYTLAVGSTATVDQPTVVPNADPTQQTVGDYNFTLQVFDDGDTGFTSSTNSGDGQVVVEAPAPIAFAGPDQVFGTQDDVSDVEINGFRFVLNRGADGQPNTGDDTVSGTNGSIDSTRTANGVVTSTIRSAIGLPGNAGVPTSATPDIDVFHLNNRQPITPGTKYRVTVKLTEAGADLGSNTTVSQPVSEPRPPVDLRGLVQFGLFETTGSTDIDDADMVFSPTDFKATGGKAARVIADNGSTKYGYDANGDFFIEFVTPNSTAPGTSQGTFAVYLQGLFNTDYQLEIVRNGTGEQPVKLRQNFVIETRGGTIDWLEAGGQTTTLSAFDAAAIGLNGNIDGRSVNEYILTSLVTQLNSLFQSGLGGTQPGERGFDIRFSTNPADFEFQPFSTIYLSSTVDPITGVLQNFFFNNATFNSTVFGANTAFGSTQPYGASEHSDSLNADREDEAVVFVPSFQLFGLTPSRADVDSFSKSLTAATARRAGELMGLRINTTNSPDSTTPLIDPGVDFMASDSPNLIPGAGANYVLRSDSRFLSGIGDSIENSNFLMGRQNTRSLLDRIVARF